MTGTSDLANIVTTGLVVGVAIKSLDVIDHTLNKSRKTTKKVNKKQKPFKKTKRSKAFSW